MAVDVREEKRKEHDVWFYFSLKHLIDFLSEWK